MFSVISASAAVVAVDTTLLTLLMLRGARTRANAVLLMVLAFAVAAPLQARSPKPSVELAHTVSFIPNRGQAPAGVLWQAEGRGFEASFRKDGFVLRVYGAGKQSPAKIIEQDLSLAGINQRSIIEALDPQPGKISFFRGNNPARWVRGLPTYARLRYKNVYPGIDLLFYGNHGTLEYDFVVAPNADPSVIRLRLDAGSPARITARGELQVGEGSEAVLHRPLLYQNIGSGKRMIEGKFVRRDQNTVAFHFSNYDASKTLIIDPALSLLYSTYLGGYHDDEATAVALDAQEDSYILGFSQSPNYPISGNAYQQQRANDTQLLSNVVLTKISSSGVLLFSTFVGGSTGDTSGGIVLDSQGNAYFAGFTKSTDFPVTANAYQTTFPSGATSSSFFAELSPDGSALLYSSFFGGSGGAGPGYGFAIARNPQGNVVVSGNAGPGLPTTSNAYLKQISSGTAAYVAVFNLALSGAAQLVASTYYGASTPAANNSATGNIVQNMALDSSGNPWIAGQSYTNNLPTTGNAYQGSVPAINPNCGGGELNSAAYFAKLSADLTTLDYASYISGKTAGGACSEYAHAIVLDSSGNVYVAGTTGSTAFPTTSGVFQQTDPAAGYAEFVSKVSPDGTHLLWSTYLGGNGGSNFQDSLALDSQNNVWVSGTTQGGANFPLVNAYQATEGGGYDGHITEIKSDGTAVLYSTYLGGSGDDVAADLALDAQGNVYVVGYTTSTNFPVTSNAFEPQKAYGGPDYNGNDIFFTVLGTASIGIIGPLTGGNAGDTTVTVNGAGIQQGATCTLVGNTTIQATAVNVSSDGTTMTCTFALNGLATGNYSLSVTNPGGSPITGKQPFQVVQGTGPQIQTNVVGRSLVRIGVPSTFTLVITNSGDADAYFTHVWVAIPSDIQIGFANPILDPYVADNDTTTDYSFFVAGIPDQDGNTYYGIIVPHLPGGAITSLQFQLTVPDQESLDIYTYSQLPWFSQLSDAQTAFQSLSANAAASPTTCIFTPSQIVRDCSGAYVNETASDLVSADGANAIDVGDPGQARLSLIQFIAGRLGLLLQPAALNTTALIRSHTARNGVASNVTPRADKGGGEGGGAHEGGFWDNALGGLWNGSWQQQHMRMSFDLAACGPIAATKTVKKLQTCTCNTPTILVQVTEDCMYAPPPRLSWQETEDCPLYKPKKPKPPKNPHCKVSLQGESALRPVASLTPGKQSALPVSMDRILRPLDGESCDADDNSDDNANGNSGSDSGGCSGGSGDPNDKTGPTGDGSPAAYITGNTPLTYNVAFENEATATLPAAQVVITDQLDPTKVNLTTLTLTLVWFGTNVITMPSGTSNFNTTFNISSSLSVRIQGSVNTDTGLLKWTFTSIDPSTGLPPSDPTVGFLPPDANGVEGQGSVVFSVMPKSGLTTGTQITNQAVVVFDANAPINTPTWLNTIDINPPHSSVTALPAAEVQSTFTVSWSGTDVGSGIATYNIYVSDNGGPYTLWQNNVAGTSAAFSGAPGHTYAFYSIATDGAGNVEGSKSTPDTRTTISASASGPQLSISKSHVGSFTRGQTTAQYTLTVSDGASAGATSGTVTVTEMPPAGLLTVTSMSGNGWTCGATSCTRGDPLFPGASYLPITVTATVATASVPSLITNTASVSGGGSASANASDPTTISGIGILNTDYADNGRDDALLYDPVGGTAYAALSNGNGTYSYVYNLFTPGFDTLRMGDFNGDGKVDLVTYNSKTAAAYIGFGTGTGTFNFQSLFWSPGYNIVEQGDINGDGMTDFALYNGLTGTLYTGISNGDGTFTYQYHLVSMGFTFIRLADFTGDGRADLFLYNAANGTAFLGVGDGAGNFAFNPLSISPGYNLADIGDLNGDGKADIILYNSTNGNAATGISTGLGGFTFTPLIFSPGFTSVRLADYTGDGKADVTVYNMNTSTAYFGTGTGTGNFNFQSLFWSPGYNYVIPEDVTGNGKMDVILYNSTTGTEYTGISNGNGTFTYTYQYWGIGKVLAQ